MFALTRRTSFAAAAPEIAALRDAEPYEGVVVFKDDGSPESARIADALINMEQVVFYPDDPAERQADFERRSGKTNSRRAILYIPGQDGLPVVAVSVAHTHELGSSLDQLQEGTDLNGSPPNAITCYTISNSKAGGGKGRVLIENGVRQQQRHLNGSLQLAGTLSPIMTLRDWVANIPATVLPNAEALIQESRYGFNLGELRTYLASIITPEGVQEISRDPNVVNALRQLAALHSVLPTEGDMVARFHFKNKAALAAITEVSDTSPAGIKRSWGIMRNFGYMPQPKDPAANENDRPRSAEIDAMLGPHVAPRRRVWRLGWGGGVKKPDWAQALAAPQSL